MRTASALAAGLATAAGVGYLGGGSYVWAERLFGSYLVFAAGSLAAGAYRLAQVTRPLGRVAKSVAHLGIGLAVMAVVAAVPFGILGLLAGSSQVVAEAESPDGRATAVVIAEPWAIDTAYLVRIRQQGGLLARHWKAGCLNGDDPAEAYDSMTWTSPDVLTVRTGSGRDLVVRLDSESSQPLNTVRAGIDMCSE